MGEEKELWCPAVREKAGKKREIQQVQNKRRHGVYFYVMFLKTQKCDLLKNLTMKNSNTVLNYVDDKFRVIHC